MAREQRGNSVNGGYDTFGTSDILYVRPGNIISESNFTRFKDIVITKDPVTNVYGTLLVRNGNAIEVVSNNDLIVARAETTADTDTFNSVIILPDATLTVE